MTRILLLAFLLYSHTVWGDAIRVTSEYGAPITNAGVLIGLDVNNPFPNNQVSTNAQGEFQIPTVWKSLLPVTVQAPGFVQTTFSSVAPLASTLEIHVADGTGRYEIKGVAEDFGKLRTDGFVDFALVLPSMTRTQILHFDLSAVLSPETDTLSIVGKKFDIPSNISLPDQIENYVIPIRLNKPAYRSYLRQEGEYLMTALHGKFPIKQVVDEMQNGTKIFDLINYFTLLGAGQQVVDVAGSSTTSNIVVSQIIFDTKMPVQAPNYAPGRVMLALGMVENNGVLYPTDLKRIKAGQSMNLVFPSNSDPKFVMSLLTEDKNPVKVAASDPQANSITVGAISLALQPASTTSAPQFLDFVTAPKIDNGQVVLQAPPAVKGLTPMATYVILSEVEEVGAGKVKSEKRTRLWEIFSPSWVNVIDLPNVEIQQEAGKKYRLEVMYLATTATNTTGNFDLDTVTHFTRNSIDF